MVGLPAEASTWALPTARRACPLRNARLGSKGNYYCGGGWRRGKGGQPERRRSCGLAAAARLANALHDRAKRARRSTQVGAGGRHEEGDDYHILLLNKHAGASQVRHVRGPPTRKTTSQTAIDQHAPLQHEHAGAATASAATLESWERTGQATPSCSSSSSSCQCAGGRRGLLPPSLRVWQRAGARYGDATSRGWTCRTSTSRRSSWRTSSRKRSGCSALIRFLKYEISSSIRWGVENVRAAFRREYVCFNLFKHGSCPGCALTHLEAPCSSLVRAARGRRRAGRASVEPPRSLGGCAQSTRITQCVSQPRGQG